MSSLPLVPYVPAKRVADSNLAIIHGANKRRKEDAPRGRGSHRRNYIKELEDTYKEPGSLEQELLRLQRRHIRPITAATADAYHRAEKAWITTFTYLLKSEEAALETLKEGAEFPHMDQVKCFVRNVAVHAPSRIGTGSQGMSMDTARRFLVRMHGMRRQLGCKSATKEQKIELGDFVTCLAKVDKVIPTGNLPKRFVRELDMYDFMGACFDPKVVFQIGFDRVQTAALGQMLYILGQRPGCIVENSNYTGLGQVLKWEDMDWIILGWEPGLGLQFQVFIKFHHMKNMRDDDGKFMQTSMRSAGRDHILLDPIISLLAMALEHNIFVEDVFSFSEDHTKLPQLPYQLTIRPNKQSQPVFTQVTKGDPNFKSAHAFQNRVGPLLELPKNQRKQTGETSLGPWTYFAAAKAVQKIGNYLGWRMFKMYSFRYAWAGNALGKMSSAHLRHHMGHQPKTLMASTTYQCPDRPVDVTAVRFGIEADLSASDYHSSVAWERFVTERSTFESNAETFRKNPTTKPYYELLMEAEAKVKAEFNCYSEAVDDEHCNHVLVVAAHDARVDLLSAYTDTTSFGVRNAHAKLLKQVKAASMASPKPTLDHPSIAKATEQSPVDLQAISPDEEEELAYKISCITSNHPYQTLIDNDRRNPSHTLLARYTAAIAFGKIREQAMCGYCFTNEQLKESQRLKKHLRYSEHVWSCSLQHNPDTWRCPICTDLVPCSPGTNEILEDHLASCFKTLDAVSAAFVLDQDENIKDVDEEDGEDDGIALETSESIRRQAASCRVGAKKNVFSDPESSVGPGAYRLSISTKVDSSRKNSRRFFCPICFYAPSRSGKKISQLSGEDSRFKFFWDTTRLGQHIASHWKTLSKSSFSGIKYDLEIKCGFSECQHLPKMNTGEAISHLHNEHNYKLVECAVKHTHTKLCFLLPTSFTTKATGILIAKHMQSKLHSTTLRDFNRKDKIAKSQKAHEARIVELAVDAKGIKVENASTLPDEEIMELLNDIVDWCLEPELDIEFEVKEEELLHDFMLWAL